MSNGDPLKELTEFMQSRRFEQLMLGDGEDLVAVRSDGTQERLEGDPFGDTLTTILREMLPNGFTAASLAGGPLRLQYGREGEVVDFEVSQADHGKLITIVLSPRAIVLELDAEESETPIAKAPPIVAEKRGTTVAQTLAPPQMALSAATVTVAPAPGRPSLRTDKSFPKRVPWSLRVPETLLRWLSAAVGIGLGIGSSFLIYQSTSSRSLLGRMFDLDRVETAIPVTISCLFCWAILICCVRLYRLWGLERTSRKTILAAATGILRSPGGVEILATDLQERVCQVSPLLKRLQAIVQQWLVRPSLQDADIVLQQNVAYDEEAVHAGYALVRTFIWALPVLGLVGTVLGISNAVGGFASFLGGSIEDVAVIKRNLVNVTDGLSFAFLITLQGLLTSLIVMLIASTLQTREERLYATVQKEITDKFFPVLQNVSPEPNARGADTEMNTWLGKIQETSVGALGIIRDTSREILTQLGKRDDAQRQLIAEHLGGWRNALEKTAEGVLLQLKATSSELVEKTSTDLQAGVSQVREQLQARGESMANASAALLQVNRDAAAEVMRMQEALRQSQAAAAEQAGAVAQHHDQTLATFAEQTKAIQATSQAIASLGKATEGALEHQTALEDALRLLSQADSQQRSAAVVEALGAQASKLEAATEASRQLAHSTSLVLSSQAVLQQAIQQLHETGLEQTLSEFRDALAALGPVLESFRRPFVLQAVALESAPR